MLRSVPFFAYRMAVDDEVETDEELVIQRVGARSGHRVLRVAAHAETADQVHAELHPLLEAERLGHEWHRVGYVAVDIPPGTEIDGLVARLEALEADGVLSFELA